MYGVWCIYIFMRLLLCVCLLVCLLFFSLLCFLPIVVIAYNKNRLWMNEWIDLILYFSRCAIWLEKEEKCVPHKQHIAMVVVPQHCVCACVCLCLHQKCQPTFFPGIICMINVLAPNIGLSFLVSSSFSSNILIWWIFNADTFLITSELNFKWASALRLYDSLLFASNTNANQHFKINSTRAMKI